MAIGFHAYRSGEEADIEKALYLKRRRGKPKGAAKYDPMQVAISYFWLTETKGYKPEQAKKIMAYISAAVARTLERDIREKDYVRQWGKKHLGKALTDKATQKLGEAIDKYDRAQAAQKERKARDKDS